MKKILPLIIFILSVFISIESVYALNKLYFTDSGDRLYYDTNQLDAKVFMNHRDMIPGSTYTDELVIENGSKTDYILFFKVIEKADQSDVANELLDNITMKIYLDNRLIYDGYAKGMDYSDVGINLQDVIELGTFKSGVQGTIVVETTLSPEYDNIDNDEESYIDWTFYASYEEEIKEIVPNPDTGDELKGYTILFVSVFIIFLILIFIRTILYVKRKYSI